MEIYSEIAKIKTNDDMEQAVKKLEFNFGEVPNEVINLMYVARVKNACADLDVKRVSIGLKNTTITFNSANNKLLEGLSKLMLENRLGCVLNLETLPIITIKNDTNLFITLENILFALKLLK